MYVRILYHTFVRGGLGVNIAVFVKVSDPCVET